MNHKRIINILYLMLAAVCCVVLYCMGMLIMCGIVNHNKENPAEQEVQADTNDDRTLNQCAFDQYMEGKQELCQKPLEINGVKTAVFYMDTFDKKPLVILQHGLSSKKEDMNSFATALAERGFFVVTPDAMGHGEDETEERHTVIELVYGTANYFEAIIKYFEASEYVDTERLGLVGLSLGGMTSFYYTANGSYNPKVVVSLCSTPKFEDLIGTDVASSFIAKGKTVATAGAREQELMDTQIRDYSPYNRLLTDKDTCFFMLCGDADSIVPHEGNIQFYEEVQDIAKNVMLVVKKDQQHEIVLEDLMRVIEYLEQYL